MAALDDRALVAAMRLHDPHAWAEFDARFRPALTEFARRVRLTDGLIDGDVRDRLVDELLAEEAARLTSTNAVEVGVLTPYLLRAARHRLYNLRRSAKRRARRYEEATTEAALDHPMPPAKTTASSASTNDPVASPLSSEFATRVSRGVQDVTYVDADPSCTAVREGRVDASAPMAAFAGGPEREAAAAARLAARLRASTTDDELLLLTWVAQLVPHRTIASWLDVSYEAATKRIWRLCRRLRETAIAWVSTLEPHERRDIERFLRRAGALPPLVAAPFVQHLGSSDVHSHEDHA